MAIQSYEETPLTYQKNGTIWQCFVFDLPWKIAGFLFGCHFDPSPWSKSLRERCEEVYPRIFVANYRFSIPIGSMYAIYGNIYHKYPPNVSIYTIHGSYGIWIFTNGLRMFKVLVDRFGKVGPPFTLARCWCTTPLLYIIWLSWLIK